MSSRRRDWAGLSNAELLGQCEVDTYRASGPGGQKRNKTSSAVRLRHRPSGLIVIAEESRSQHENKSRALRRLRKAIFLELREEIPADSLKTDAIVCRPELTAVMSKGPKLECSPKRPEFWPAVGLILDLLAATQSRVSETASLIGVSTGNLIGFLEAD